MKAKAIQIKSIEQGLTEFAETFKKVRRRQLVRRQRGTFFANLDAVRRVLTTERVRMLRYIKREKPGSIYALARGLNRDLKNVSQDLSFLKDLGLIELRKTTGARSRKRPVLLSDHVTLKLAI